MAGLMAQDILLEDVGVRGGHAQALASGSGTVCGLA